MVRGRILHLASSAVLVHAALAAAGGCPEPASDAGARPAPPPPQPAARHAEATLQDASADAGACWLQRDAGGRSATAKQAAKDRDAAPAALDLDAQAKPSRGAIAADLRSNASHGRLDSDASSSRLLVSAAAPAADGGNLTVAEADAPGDAEASADKSASAPPRKSKVVLMILEMVPLLGPLGIDRFYLGCNMLAVAKFTICVCTCLVGGLIWGLVDAIVVIANSLTRKKYIDDIGMVAEFGDDEIEPAHFLAVIAALFQVFFLCGGPRLIPFLQARWRGCKPSSSGAGYAAAANVSNTGPPAGSVLTEAK